MRAVCIEVRLPKIETRGEACGHGYAGSEERSEKDQRHCMRERGRALDHRSSVLNILESRNDVVDGRETFEDRDECPQFGVVHIIKPTAHRNLNEEREKRMKARCQFEYNVQHYLDEICRILVNYQ